MGNAAAIAAAFPGGLPPGISGTNDRCTILVSNLNPDVSVFYQYDIGALAFFDFSIWQPNPVRSFLPTISYCYYILHLQRIDEDKLFNLFSIYGNIVRIKLLRNKPDHALVQMGDGFQAELAVHFLKVLLYT